MVPSLALHYVKCRSHSQHEDKREHAHLLHLRARLISSRNNNKKCHCQAVLLPLQPPSNLPPPSALNNSVHAVRQSCPGSYKPCKRHRRSLIYISALIPPPTAACFAIKRLSAYRWMQSDWTAAETKRMPVYLFFFLFHFWQDGKLTNLWTLRLVSSVLNPDVLITKVSKMCSKQFKKLVSIDTLQQQWAS